jgi:hypothetical protein
VSLNNFHGVFSVFLGLIWIGWPAYRSKLDLGLHLFFSFAPDFLCIPPWGQSCGRQLYDDKGVIAAQPSVAASWASAGLMTAIVLHCLCCPRHRLVSSLPPLPLAALSLFGVIVTIVAIVAVIAAVAVVAIVAIVAITLFAPVTIALATVVVTLAVIAAWFL